MTLSLSSLCSSGREKTGEISVWKTEDIEFEQHRSPVQCNMKHYSSIWPYFKPTHLTGAKLISSKTHIYTQTDKFGRLTNTHRAGTWLGYSNQIEAKFDLRGRTF